jgi:hypothetical protein
MDILNGQLEWKLYPNAFKFSNDLDDKIVELTFTEIIKNLFNLWKHSM